MQWHLSSWRCGIATLTGAGYGGHGVGSSVLHFSEFQRISDNHETECGDAIRYCFAQRYFLAPAMEFTALKNSYWEFKGASNMRYAYFMVMLCLVCLSVHFRSCTNIEYYLLATCNKHPIVLRKIPLLIFF